MTTYSLLTFIGIFFLFSCQTSQHAKQEENEAQLAETLKKFQEENTEKIQIADSIHKEFCSCLVQDSISVKKRLEMIDNFLAQNVNINIPCSFEENHSYKSVGDLLTNMGVAVSNFVLRTKFSKKSSSKTVRTDYPILMLFSEDTTFVRSLVERKANINASTHDIISLPSYYASKNDLPKLQFTFNLGAKAEEIKILTNNEKMIDFLIEKGAKTQNIDKITLFETDNYQKLAEKYKIDLSTTSCKEFNSIIKTGSFRKINFERTEWLLKNGASSSCIDGEFLEHVINEDFEGRIYGSSKKKTNEHTQQEWIELLGKYNVNWNQCNVFGKTPLTLAVEQQDINLITSLLNQKANPNFMCEFAGRKSNTKDALKETMEYAQKNEVSQKEIRKEKYSQKDAEKHVAYMTKLNEIKVLLEQQ